jgi:hypothetical protein
MAIIVFASASSIAFAQTQPPVVLAPTVPTGKQRQVDFFTSVNPDCSSTGDIDTRIIKQPEHGTIELEPGTGFAQWKPDNPRVVCNSKAVPGIRVKYTSKDDYLGKDYFEIEFLFAPAGDQTHKYNVTVK